MELTRRLFTKLAIGSIPFYAELSWAACTPVISGTAQVGQTLTASGGTGTYQWYNEGSVIAGATSSSYTLQGSDQGCLIQVLSGGVFSSLVGPVIGTTVFYVSSSTGSDASPGTLSAPWKTLSHVNAQTFQPGTSILFKRGDTWRTDGCSTSLGAQLWINNQSGTSSAPIVFDSYGTGANPIIDGSFDASQTSAWSLISGNVWQSTQTFVPSVGSASSNYGLPFNQASDVGNILWGFSTAFGSLKSASWGVMKGAGAGGVWYSPGECSAGLSSSGQWNFNTDTWRVQVYSTTNPATAMPWISLAINTASFFITNSNYIIIQNIDSQFCGMSPVMTEGTCTNITTRDMTIQWYGGGFINGENPLDARYGDGIDIEGSMQNFLAERMFFYQMYDTAFGPQCGGAHQDNITMRNCVAIGGNGFYNTFLLGSPTTVGANFYNNTCYLATGGWSCNPVQRPNGAPNISGLYPGVLGQTNLSIKNNIFAGLGGVTPAPGFGIIATTWGSQNQFSSSGAWLDYNFWSNNTASGSAQQIALPGVNETLSTWASAQTPSLESHGIFGQDPQFTSSLNLTPSSSSPCRNAGANLYGSGVVWDFNHNPRPTSGPFSMGAFQ